MQQVCHDTGGMCLCEISVLCDKIEKLATREILHDKMNAPRPDKDVDSANNIGMRDGQNDLDFPGQKLSLILATQSGDHLNSDLLISQQVMRPPDLSIHTLPDQPTDTIIILNTTTRQSSPAQSDDPFLISMLRGCQERDDTMRECDFDLARMGALLDDGMSNGDMPGGGRGSSAMG